MMNEASLVALFLSSPIESFEEEMGFLLIRDFLSAPLRMEIDEVSSPYI